MIICLFRFGRRLPLVGAVILQLASGIAASLTPEYWSFTILRFILGVATGGTMVVGYVLTMEFVGTEYREPVSAFYQLPFNIGHLMLAGFGYFFRTWSSFQLAVTIPSVLMLSYYWVLPESPRWLLAIGETSKASKILEKTAKMLVFTCQFKIFLYFQYLPLTKRLYVVMVLILMYIFKLFYSV